MQSWACWRLWRVVVKVPRCNTPKPKQTQSQASPNPNKKKQNKEVPLKMGGVVKTTARTRLSKPKPQATWNPTPAVTTNKPLTPKNQQKSTKGFLWFSLHAGLLLHGRSTFLWQPRWIKSRRGFDVPRVEKSFTGTKTTEFVWLVVLLNVKAA